MEEAEPPFSLPSGVTPQVHRPLEAVAALWSRGVGGASDGTCSYAPPAASETAAAGNEDTSPMTTAFPSSAEVGEPLTDLGLGTYNNALGEFLMPSLDSAGRMVQCGVGAMVTDLDVLQLSRDLESELSCASVLPASTLSFSALCGF